MKDSPPPAKRRRYDAVFRAEALQLVSESRSTQAAARALNINVKLLCKMRILARMKALVLASVLLTGLTSASCHKADDVTPVTPVVTLPTQEQLLIGKWVLVRQSRTDGQLTNTAMLDNSYYVREFTTDGQWLNYSGTRINYTYPYSLANGVITIDASDKIIYTISSLTSMALVLTYPGQSTYTFTDTFVRATK